MNKGIILILFVIVNVGARVTKTDLVLLHLKAERREGAEMSASANETEFNSQEEQIGESLGSRCHVILKWKASFDKSLLFSGQGPQE